MQLSIWLQYSQQEIGHNLPALTGGHSDECLRDNSQSTVLERKSRDGAAQSAVFLGRAESHRTPKHRDPCHFTDVHTEVPLMSTVPTSTQNPDPLSVIINIQSVLELLLRAVLPHSLAATPRERCPVSGPRWVLRKCAWKESVGAGAWEGRAPSTKLLPSCPPHQIQSYIRSACRPRRRSGETGTL